MFPSMKYDDTWLGSETYGILVTNTPMQIIGEPKLNTANFAQKDGGITQGGTRALSPLAINILIQGDDYTDLKTKIDALTLLIDPSNGDKDIVLDNRMDRKWTGRLASAIFDVPAGASSYRTTLNFMVQPHAEAVSETTQNITVDETPESFTVPASGTLDGSMTAKPVWLYTHTGAIVTSLTLANSTTSQTVKVTGFNIFNTHQIRFDAERQIVERSTDGGSSFSSIMEFLDTTDKTFPELAPNVSNSCSVTGSTTGTLAITYRARY
jgi:hypothetical protein